MADYCADSRKKTPIDGAEGKREYDLIHPLGKTESQYGKRIRYPGGRLASEEVTCEFPQKSLQSRRLISVDWGVKVAAWPHSRS